MENTFENTASSLYEVEHPTGINAYLMGDTTELIQLPVYPEGKFHFKNNEEILYIEGSDQKWRIHAGEGTSFFVNDKAYSKLSLKDKAMTLVKSGDQYLFFYCEYTNQESLKYHNYFVRDTKLIHVGKAENNDVIYHNRIISDHSFSLKKEGNTWEICDSRDDLFIYTNGHRMRSKLLHPGDVIAFLGIRIIIGYGFLSISDGNFRIGVNREHLLRLNRKEELVSGNEKVKASQPQLFFNRSPRRRMPMEPEQIKFEAPPMSMNSDQIPLLLRMGGSMVTSGRSLLAGNVTSMISSVLFPILNSKYTEKQKQEYEERRHEKYDAYLKDKEKQILIEKKKEEKVLKYNYPDTASVLAFEQNRVRLWERRNSDDDFMNIRIGSGDLPLMAEYEYQTERFSLDEDDLEQRMYELVNRPVLLQDVPIMNSFLEHYICGVSGSRGLQLTFVRNFINQIVMTHSYDEVKLVFLLEEQELRQIEYIRYLPHAWDDQKNIRFLATNTTDGFQLSEYLKNELEDSMKRRVELRKALKDRPYYMVIALNKKIFDSMEILKEVMKADECIGIGILAVFDGLPKDCSRIFALHDSGEHSVIHINELDKTDLAFRLDIYQKWSQAVSLQKISNLYLKMITGSYTMPKMLTFLEMFGVGKIEHLNPLQRWKTSNPVKTLCTPVGVGADGSFFELDLHQKFQGPHGLIAGMTGSGKSEFIITYILSLAINYHPDEVAFLLIDYKGGGLAGAFEDKMRGIHLPHLVGTITNLDGAMIQRSMTSMQSELTRRQKVFNEVKSMTGESSIDIYSYQSLYRNKVVTEPMPHLFIIADEFAEMKQQQPEFMDNLISIARIGRSLGVHLILATQKPSGVVNDQIRSNTKFRVCLKVQDKSDSMDMLKRPEAAELKDTGRFYLQVGYDEYFALGQSAWAGATYQPQDTVIRQKDESVQFIDELGQNILTTRKQVQSVKNGKSQLTEIVNYLSEIAEREQIHSRPLWLEPLPKKLDLEQLVPAQENGSHISVPIGLTDDPSRQQQNVLHIDLNTARNLWIVGELGCGKTTLLHTIIQYAMRHYTGRQVQFYILDPLGRSMEIYRRSPYCGAVLCEDETEHLKTFSDLIQELIRERKKRFAALEASSYEDACKKEQLPLILIVIDNLAGIKGNKIGEGYYYELAEQMKAGYNCGIRYIVTSDHMNEATMRLKQELGERLALHMKDKYEYSEVLQCRCTFVPEEDPGRGMVNADGEPIIFQTAMYLSEEDNETRKNWYKEGVENRRTACELPAKRIPQIDEEEEYETFCERYTPGRFPLGYHLKNAQPVVLPFRQFSCLPVYFGNPKGTKKILENILYVSDREDMKRYIITRKQKSVLKVETDERTEVFSCEFKEAVKLINTLTKEIVPRTTMYKEFCAEQNLDFREDESAREARSYMAEHTRPVLILFEDFLDFYQEINLKNEQDRTTFVGFFEQVLKMASRDNLYVIGCFGPGEALKLESEALLNYFRKDDIALLFGGCYQRQGIVEALPAELSKIRQELPYHKFMMRYRGNFYGMQMPCGSMEQKYKHEDDQSII